MPILQLDPAPGYEHMTVTELRKVLHSARRLTPEADAAIGLFDREGRLLATAPSNAKDFLQQWFLPPRRYLYTYEGVPELPKDLLERVAAAGERLDARDRAKAIPHWVGKPRGDS